MSRAKTAYQILERLAIDADNEKDTQFANLIHTKLHDFWDALSPQEQEELRRRPGAIRQEINPTKIEPNTEANGVVICEVYELNRK